MNFKEDQTEQKLRGGYYTPEDLAEFLVRWVSHKNPKKILEPSCGDGVFFQHIAEHIAKPEVRGFELDVAEAKKARACAKDTGLTDINIQGKDFFGWAVNEIHKGNEQFDAVLGNPPFIRYQYLPEMFQERAQAVFDTLQCKFTKHTNAWVPFVLASFALLKEGGRLAMVVPAEIIHVMHAQSLRSYLGEHCERMVIIDPKELWFSGTLQGAVLLLAEKKVNKRSRPQGLAVYPVRNREFLSTNPEAIFNTPQSINGKTVEGKWTRAFLDKPTRSLLDGLVDEHLVRRFDEVASVDVGIVTGANKYFLVDDETVREFELDRWVHPMFGRSEHCPGIIYDSEQHSVNVAKGNPTNFIWFNDLAVSRSKKAQAYIEYGESQKLHTRYKCRIRKPWYTVPSVYATEIGLLKRAHHTPRLILNRLGAYTTDTAYRIRVKEGTANQLVYGFINGLTALSAELEGRHYGGGVLELVPSEIEKLLVPNPKSVSPRIADLDSAIRRLPMDEVLERQTAKVLGGLGLTVDDQTRLLDGWNKLRDRRQRVSSVAA